MLQPVFPLLIATGFLAASMAQDARIELLGASDQSVHNWEHGKTRPLARHLPAIAAMRGMSKKDATTRLLSLQQ